MSYPEEINLPFNFASIKDSFTYSFASTNMYQHTGIYIILQSGNVIVKNNGDSFSLPSDTLPDFLKPEKNPLHIGFWNHEPVYVFTIQPTISLSEPYCAEAFNTAEDRLDPETLTLAGLGKQILHWERQSRFCSKCGGKTEALCNSFGKKCTKCGAEHFPHLHPCAIVLVKKDNEILLTRKKEWAPGRYGLVAGFLDFGESLEECAIREVREETGIEIKNVRYVGSQNWPFPAQLMAGFVADYASGEIKVDKNELEDAGWFKNDALPALPGKRSIARWIIDNHA